MTDKPSRFPDTLVLIFGLIIVAQLLTYVLQPGVFLREPKPDAGSPYKEVAGQPTLREQLTKTLDERNLSDEEFGKIMRVAPRTVGKWKLGPPTEEQKEKTVDPRELGTHVEANVGALIHEWITTRAKPTDDQIAEWKAEVDSRKQLVPGSYRKIEREKKPWHAPLTTVFTSIPKGLTNGDAIEIIIFVFLIGGVIAIMRITGAFDALIGAAIRSFGRQANMLILGTIALFAFGSGLIGMAEEYVPFIALLVTMSLAMRLDALVGISIVFVGYAVGYGCAPFNPFTVIIAQGIADLPPTSGWWYRVLLLLICLVVGSHHVIRYANKIKKDPDKSLVADIDYSSGFELPENVPLTNRRLGVLLAFGATVVVFVYGVSNWDWYLMELSAIFLALGVVVAVIGGVTPNQSAKSFCSGAAELTTTALLIGFARTIQIVLDDAQITDTVVHGIATSLEGMGKEVGAVSMLFVQSLCNFFIPSGSGQAYVTMPIMAPLATELGIEKQVAVLAYQFGDGFTNVITPTNAAFMGMLAMARVPYQRWLRFAIPLMIKFYLIAAGALVAAVWFGYS